MTDFLPSGNDNKILKSLPLSEYGRILPHLESVELKQGDIIQQVGFPTKYFYFPQTCLIGLVTIFKNGSYLESGLVGAEGLVGASSAIYQVNCNRQAQALTAGTCLRIKADIFRRLYDELISLPALIQSYFCAYHEQVVQLGACNSCHSLQERFARMLLLCSLNNRIPLTQEAAGTLLGAHRPSVTKFSLYFKSKGLINYRRGKMFITDRKGLEAEACECYQAIRDVYSIYFTQLRDQSSKPPQVQIPHFSIRQPEYGRNFPLAK